MEKVIETIKFGTDFMSFLKKYNLPEPKFWYGDVVFQSGYRNYQAYTIYGVVYPPSTQICTQWRYLCAFLRDEKDFETVTFYEESIELFEDED